MLKVRAKKSLVEIRKGYKQALFVVGYRCILTTAFGQMPGDGITLWAKCKYVQCRFIIGGEDVALSIDIRH
jgi:hypothetical protein